MLLRIYFIIIGMILQTMRRDYARTSQPELLVSLLAILKGEKSHVSSCPLSLTLDLIAVSLGQQSARLPPTLKLATAPTVRCDEWLPNTSPRAYLELNHIETPPSCTLVKPQVNVLAHQQAINTEREGQYARKNG